MPTYVHILNKPHPLVAEHFIMCLLVLLVVLYTCIIIYIVEIIMFGDTTLDETRLWIFEIHLLMWLPPTQY